MLVLNRKENEAVTINGEIEVRVLSITAGRVRLAFTANPNILILRKELTKNTDQKKTA